MRDEIKRMNKQELVAGHGNALIDRERLRRSGPRFWWTKRRRATHRFEMAELNQKIRDFETEIYRRMPR